MGVGRPNNQPFLKTLARQPCIPVKNGYVAAIELRPNDLALPRILRLD
jgi:hypothetical protein